MNTIYEGEGWKNKDKVDGRDENNVWRNYLEKWKKEVWEEQDQEDNQDKMGLTRRGWR